MPVSLRHVLSAAAALAMATAPLGAQTSLTIYNDGRVLLRRTVPVTVPSGASDVRLTLGQMDPGTLVSLDSGLTIMETRYDGATDEGSALRRAVGRLLTFQSGSKERDTVSATLVGVDPERYRLRDGTISFARPGTLHYPPELAVVDPLLQLRVRSARARNAMAVGYFTNGSAWQASYQVVLGATGQARVEGAAVLTNQTLDVDSAEVQLVAGVIGRAAAAPRPMMAEAMGKSRAFASDAVTQERVGDAHLYTMPGRWTLRPGVISSIALFEPATVKIERAYVVRGQIPYYGVLMPRGDETDEPVQVTYTVARPRKSELGDRPLPAGIARIFTSDSAGRLQLVGEAATNHAPAGKDLVLDAATAFDLTARRVQTNYVSRRDSTRTGVRSGATADYRVTLTNAGEQAATIDVFEERAGDWSVVSSSVPAEKVSSTVTRFRVKVPARGDATLTYRVNVTW